jgi:hypothetical protein
LRVKIKKHAKKNEKTRDVLTGAMALKICCVVSVVLIVELMHPQQVANECE